MRLRQIVIVARDIERVEAEFFSIFGWRVAFRDPVVARWGLRNIVIPVGNEFIEVVSPTRENTSAGRHLERLGGDGGYMMMFQVADRALETRRLESAGVRAVYRSDQETYCLTQFHPGDCGGLILAWEQVLHPAGADWRQPDGYWHAANGTAWLAYVSTARVGSIRRVVLGAASGSRLAEVYARLLGRPAVPDDAGWSISLQGPRVGFEDVSSAATRVCIELDTPDPQAVLRAAEARSMPVAEHEVTVAGIGFRLIPQRNVTR